MTAADLLLHATTLALAMLVLALLLSVVRLVRGPSLADRILALDTMTTLGIGVIAVMAIRTGIMLYLDIALALALVGFLSTVALARYLFERHVKRGAES
jgi:multicomponent Na+:H+ antiporter subunit F